MREAVKVVNFLLSHNLTSQTHPSKSPLKIDQQKNCKKRFFFIKRHFCRKQMEDMQIVGGAESHPSLSVTRCHITTTSKCPIKKRCPIKKESHPSDTLPHNYHFHFFAPTHLFFLSFIHPSYHITITSFFILFFKPLILCISRLFIFKSGNLVLLLNYL